VIDLWYVLVSLMFAAYVVLDGYDLGAGILHIAVAKTPEERKAVVGSVAPYWDGNEVFLVAGGATLYLAFPRLFPTFFSGFYLPLMMVLWLLALRALGIEMRHKLDHPLWNTLWDGGFFLASALLVFVFGAALGNVVRGVTVREDGSFFAPLWTDLGVGDEVGILDWYTVLVGVTALAITAHHGALWLSWRAPLVAARANALAPRLHVAAVALAFVASLATFHVQPHVMPELLAHPWTAVFPVTAAFGAAGAHVFRRRAQPARAFGASCAFLAGLFGCACAGIHPYGLIARNPARSVLAQSMAADRYAMEVALMWWLPGMALVTAYFIVVHRRLAASESR
jgi:cytochrome d ubiquinol oxidase subunit II